jgi:hypothetical protein
MGRLIRSCDGRVRWPWDLSFGGTKKAVIQQVDTGNCIEGGGDPVALIKRFPGR